MASGTTIIRKLQKKQYTKETLSQFVQYMKNREYRMELLQLALEYPIFYETICALETAGIPDCMKAQAEQLVALIQKGILSEAEDNAGLVVQIEALRQEVTQDMKIVSGYTDHMVLYEYVLNRKEYAFRDASGVESLSDQALTERIMQYLTSDKDNQAVQMRTKEVIAQLPMRMTRQRFLEIVEDGLSCYIGSEKRTVNEVVYLLRSAAGLSLDEMDGKERFGDLAQADRFIGGVVAEELDKEQFEAAYEALQQAMERLNAYTDGLICMQQIVNHVYVLLLCRRVGLAQLTEQESCLEILRQIDRCFAADPKPELGDTLDELFVAVEGIQEQLQEQLQTAEAVLEELPRPWKDAAIEEQLHHLDWCIRLQSSSAFADLESGPSEIADESYMKETTLALCREYQACLKGKSKRMARGIMANVLQILPLFVHNYEEIEHYVQTSLLNCTDEAERTASRELLLQLMQDRFA